MGSTTSSPSRSNCSMAWPSTVSSGAQGRDTAPRLTRVRFSRWRGNRNAGDRRQIRSPPRTFVPRTTRESSRRPRASSARLEPDPADLCQRRSTTRRCSPRWAWSQVILARCSKGHRSDPSRFTSIQPLMEYLRDHDAAYLGRSRELAFLANTLMVGCSVQSRSFTPHEASEAVRRDLQPGAGALAGSMG